MAKASEIVTQVMRACLPDNAPLSFKEVVSASFQGKDRIAASVVMFDDQPASLSLSRWAFGWSHRWSDLPGGACFLDADNSWKRVALKAEDGRHG